MILDDVREAYVRILDAADFARGFEDDDQYWAGVAEAYIRSGVVLREILHKYDDNSYLDHEPLT